MQAIILAAGMGKRLGDLTRNNTKCMVEVNGVTLIERLLNQLDNVKTRSIDRIIIVTGYEGQKLRDFISTRDIKTPIVYVDNPDYATTNNIYSLWLAKDYMLQDDTLLFESDLIFESAVIERLLLDPTPSLALVSKYESWMDGTVVKLGENYAIERFIPGTEFSYDECNHYYKTVNVYKFSKQFSTTHYVPFLEAYSKALGNNEYYEQVLRVITLLDKPEIKASPLNGEAWYEIDDIQDLDIAESIFCDSKEQCARLEKRHGGFWRYPTVLDFYYPNNPLFPNDRLKAELKANYEKLIQSYPSGTNVNTLLAAKLFGIRQDYACIGNGVHELIKELMNSLQGNLGVIQPTYDEYANRLGAGRVVEMQTAEQRFSYTAEDVMNFFADKDISALLLMNPNTPSANFISKGGVRQLCDWSRNKGIQLIVDETFVDFTDEGAENSLIANDILEAYPNLIVLKGISEAHGVPGMRLGILATANTELATAIKQSTAIWNINSVGEFYLQIFGKYEKIYKRACAEYREESKRLANELTKVPYLSVVPGQANYIMCEVLPPYTSRLLTEQLLSRHKILVKDCSTKPSMAESNYIRIAVRSAEENNRLLAALHRLATV